MKFFNTKKDAPRSIEDILTPKEMGEEVSMEDVVEEGKSQGESELNLVEESVGALDCFGMKGYKTEVWLAKCAKIWYGIMSFFWFLIGAFTFAPTIFISGKVNVIFKNKKKSLFVGAIIYGLIVSFIVCLIITRNA